MKEYNWKDLTRIIPKNNKLKRLTAQIGDAYSTSTLTQEHLNNWYHNLIPQNKYQNDDSYKSLWTK